MTAINEICRPEVEDFLFYEAELLDEWRLDEWLTLFTDDAHYYVPSTDVAPDASPDNNLFYIADDRYRLEARGAGRPRHGLGQRRLSLDAALWRAAAKTTGVRAREGVPVQGPLLEAGRVTGVVVDGQPRRAAWVVAAEGSSSTLRRRLGLERTRGPWRMGIRAHFRRPTDQRRHRLPAPQRHAQRACRRLLGRRLREVRRRAYWDVVIGPVCRVAAICFGSGRRRQS